MKVTRREQEPTHTNSNGGVGRSSALVDAVAYIHAHLLLAATPVSSQ